MWSSIPLGNIRCLKVFIHCFPFCFVIKVKTRKKKGEGGGESEGVYSDTAVSTKVVQKKRESVYENAKR